MHDTIFLHLVTPFPSHLLKKQEYVYTDSGTHFYADSLFAFVTLDPAGWIHIEGRATRYRDEVPHKVKARFPASISDHSIRLFIPKP